MNELYVVMYHYVRDLVNSRYPRIRGLDYGLFQQQIRFLKENFNIISMEQAVDAFNSQNASLPDRAVILTFDDGYLDHYMNVFPILKEHKIQGSFFIPGKTFHENILLDVNKIHFILAVSDDKTLVSELLKQLDYYRGREYDYPSNEELFLKFAVANRFDTKETIFVKRILQTAIPEKLRNVIADNLFRKLVGIPEEKFARELYMNREQIRLMKSEGMFIGLHGYDHYWLGDLNQDQMKLDIEQALQVMGEFIDKDGWVMNYPYGSYNQNVIDYISRRGCIAALTTQVRAAKLRRDSRYTIPRLDTNDFPPKSEKYKDMMEM